MKSLVVKVAAGRPGKKDVPEVGPTYRNIEAKDGFLALQGISSLWELFESSVKRFPGSQCLGSRPGPDATFEWLTYQQVMDRVAAVASALHKLPKNSTVGIYANNSPEWIIAMQACNRMSLVCVPLYDSLGEDAVEYIVNHSETTVVFVASNKLPTLVAALPSCPRVTTVVFWGDAAEVKLPTNGSVAFQSFADFIRKGEAAPAPARPPAGEDLCTIMYTSGTTGVPKGVMLTHGNILRVVAAVSAHADAYIKPGDVYLSFLPLAHIFDRSCADTYLSRGASIGYWQGNVKLLMSDIAALRPTGFFGVPRVFDRIYDSVMQRIQAGSPLKRAVFQACFCWKRMWMSLGWAQDQASPLADALVFNKIKAALGGRCQFLFSGAAPLAAHVEEFLRVALCTRAVQGFGLTETCAGSFLAPLDDYSHLGYCGAPLPCIEVRLEAVPEMRYSPSGRPARGELCLRGPSVFQGYFKQPDLTKDVFDSDGFFHTGDIAELRGDGSMKIIDRRKNFFKLSQGEYVAAEKIEGVVKSASCVDQVWVYGSSFESCLVAVVVPNEAALTAWAKASGRPHTDFKVLCDSDAAQQYVLDEMTAVSRAARLKGFEMVKAVHLDAELFSIEKELLTPTFKLKRPQLYARYKKDVHQMYAGLRHARQ
ncbi:hypothetical protein WJX72_004272 [[Myrmecia] bisecta]|uniref:Long-chain-fatty-acid--CoA ligase n=1 Tax=[Myrmecia] bisecta TaxID=41462 RepID=A0AAW1Q4F0_9CHLO